MRVAFIFPGQGAQTPGMGKEIAKVFPAAAEVFAQANQILGIDMSTLCFEGPKSQLDQTEFAQPALLTTGIAIYQVLKQHGITPVMMAGLSLGEYTALTAAGALTLEEALPLVRKRGQLMQQAVAPGAGAMAAIMGASAEAIEAACLATDSNAQIANYNAPGQIVISGTAAAVAEAGAALKAAGARYLPLAVSVPSHSALMKPAAEQLKSELQAIAWKSPEVPVVSNVNAITNSAENFSGILMQQLYCPVRWEESVHYLKKQVDHLIEIGPGTTLSAIVKRIDKEFILGSVEDAVGLEKILQAIA